MTSLRPSYSALVIGASGGIGSALCAILGSDSACREVVTLSRRENGFDLMEEASIAACAERLAGQQHSFDLIVCATGALTINGVGPEKAIKAVTSEAMAAQFALNAIGPALVLKYFTPLLAKNSRSLMGFLSARVGSIGDNRLGGWISYRASKAALNQIVHTSAIEIARSRPQSVIVSLHPGSVDTGLSANFAVGHERFAPDHSAGLLLSVLDTLPPAQTGGFFAYDGSVIEW
ncbi:SDR family NAD(P)-dependent oxidoreductase [Agrobacterium vitis]|uniref:SDR family NAD(P)-dependent oxidoreductase n=2 Tax=Agrobacterium vitis TaxID=373 RepID=A0AAE4WBY8_AGRVI|nr:SDR family NAD(P)-dependent oxidoreductase [Agrobacterium vitis]MCF1499534.1 SDR family NAD(P)-dependent oxidoreductase [Allorhizobium sp. Av2]MCM2439212.1 SDR family NAD(P)-dependent oxidoreductase [Agrobacterium vitis]MUZ57882.1 SDR family NAD(P)-dependent oxidoreductase [Agrobacterium vitis]MVA67718.1 SDR family NAD(P)-dependent oxidoreductase [Agrobacterium vitis]MVA87619.1 SDR family NAD(P)-dependent oxidoreductase [Agrobacterium vitis]